MNSYYIVRRKEKNAWRQAEPYPFRTKKAAINLARKLKKDRENVFVTTVEVVKITEEKISWKSSYSGRAARS